ncbi:MAG: phage major capsid protein [Lysobacterales bacterium]
MNELQDIERALEKTHDVFKADFSDKLTEISDKVKELEQKGVGRIDYSRAPPKPSLLKVIKHLANPRDNPLDGKEREWHEELSRKNAGVPGTSGAVWIPLSTKSVLDYNTPNFNSPLESAGGQYLVPTELRSREFIDILRQESVVMRQGIRVLQATGDLDVPKKLSGATAYWLNLDGTDSITESVPIFGSLQLRPKFVAGLVTVSYRMLLQTGGAVEQIIAEDLAAVLAEEIDLKALQGTGSNNQPTGVLNAGIGSLTWGGSDSPLSFDPSRFWLNDAADMEKTLIDAKAYRGNLSWLMGSSAYRSIRWQETATEGQSMFGLDAGSRLLGFPVTVSAHMPANTAVLGDWSQFVMAEWGGIALAVDGGGENFAKANTSIRAIMPVDFAVRHAAAFVKNVAP